MVGLEILIPQRLFYKPRYLNFYLVEEMRIVSSPLRDGKAGDDNAR